MNDRVDDAVAYLRDRWEWDRAWRDQILLAIIVGAIGLLFTWLSARVSSTVIPGA